MRRSPSLILGVPIDTFSMDEAVAYIFQLVEDHAQDGRPRLVCTANTDFIVNTLSWSMRRSRHSELLDILRGADLVTPDGMPVVWAGRCLGAPFKGRVTGADLVPRLAREAAARGKSLYLLGGSPGSAKKASELLRAHNSGLVIAGWSSPYVHVQGGELVRSFEADREIVGAINAARPDILLIGFGNPKQEIWFHLNRHRLRVPVSIGVGGTFEFITGSTRRAPAWMQELGLEWFHRLCQDPSRLAKRYLADLVKFGILIWPSIAIHKRLRFAVGDKAEDKENTAARFEHLMLGDRKVLLVRLPRTVDARAVQSMEDLFGDAPQCDIILDCRDVRYLDAIGLAFVAMVAITAKNEGREVALAGMGPSMERQLLYNRIIDLFEGSTFSSVSEATSHMGEGPRWTGYTLTLAEVAEMGVVVVTGRLARLPSPAEDGALLAHQVGHASLCIDLTGCTSIDTSGIVFLLALAYALRDSGKTCTIKGARRSVRQTMKMAGVDAILDGRAR